MLLPVAMMLVLAFSVPANAILKSPTRTAFLLGVYLLSAADIILVAQVAGSLGLLNSRPFFLACHALLAALAWGAWRWRGQPPLLGPLAGLGSGLNRQAVRACLWRHPDLWVLGTGICLAYGANAGLVLFVPPNNYDSMTAHMSRVGYWLQHGSLHPWPTHNILQAVYPINAQVQILWTVLFWGTDQLAGFIQWTAVPVSMLAIYGLARVMGWNRAPCVFAAFIWATFTEVVLQSTSTQNHLIVSALGVIMFYLLFLGMRTRHTGTLVLSGLSLGMAVGTHQAFLFFGPGLALITLLLLFPLRRDTWRIVFLWAAACTVSVLLVGSYMYLLNLWKYGHPMGPTRLVHSQSISTSATWLKLLAVNTSRFAYQFIDPSGLPDAIARRLVDLKADSAHALYAWLNDASTMVYGTFPFRKLPMLHEDRAWFGPLGVLLLLPAACVQCCQAILERERVRLGLIGATLSLLLGVSIFRAGWTPAQGRYFVAAVTICAPFLACVYGHGRWRSLLRWAVVGIALLVLGRTTLCNEAKPLVGPQAIGWGMDRTARQMANRWAIDLDVRLVEQVVPRGSTLGIAFGDHDWDYPLFGKHFDRRIVPIWPDTNATNTLWLQSHGIDYVLISMQSPADAVEIPSGYALLAKTGYRALGRRWTLWRRQEGEFLQMDARARRSLLAVDKAPPDKPLVKVAPILSGRIGVSPYLVTAWPSAGTAWLGNGAIHGLQGILWADTSQTVNVVLYVAVGPARTDSVRTLELTLPAVAGSQPVRQEFSQDTNLTFSVQLVPGANPFSIEVLDTPTVVPLPDGDPRPLLVRLHRMAVVPAPGP